MKIVSEIKNEKGDVIRRRVVHMPVGESRTEQSHKNDVDINKIMARYQKTGVIEFRNRHEGHYGDALAIEYREALEIARQGEEMFSQLPSKLRKRFNNDPASFLTFVQDAGNRDEAISLGLIDPPELPENRDPEPSSLGDKSQA